MTNENADNEKRTDLEVTVLPNGVVNVHRPESDRAHSVIVDETSGDVLRCSCKGHKFHGHCVHQDEVSERPLVVSSAQAVSSTERVATDGGQTVDEHETEDDETENSREKPQKAAKADFGHGNESGMDNLGDPADTVENEEDDTEEEETAGGSGLGTVTGWEPSRNRVPEDEEVDRTPL